ncbi:MAG: HAD-IA family hydrolase [Alphaproteobacteria bacterium]|nr:HAD-IA family hydrolase [Alphaproteobacteria bacterium]
MKVQTDVMPPIHAIIFDFDGVIVESEILSGRILSQYLNEQGIKITPSDAITRFFGQRLRDTMPPFFAEQGRAMPPNLLTDLKARDAVAHESELVAVAGAHTFIAGLGDFPRAIASSSATEVITRNLVKVGLDGAFGTHIYSAAKIERGKPHPDIYLQAAAGLRVDPAHCLAIEDSVTGARAAVAAEMQVIGLLAGTHILDKAAHGALLSAVGVHRIARKYNEIQKYINVSR